MHHSAHAQLLSILSFQQSGLPPSASGRSWLESCRQASAACSVLTAITANGESLGICWAGTCILTISSANGQAFTGWLMTLHQGTGCMWLKALACCLLPGKGDKHHHPQCTTTVPRSIAPPYSAVHADAEAAAVRGGPSHTPKKRKASSRNAASFSQQQVAACWQAYQGRLQRPDLQQIAAQTAALPIASYRSLSDMADLAAVGSVHCSLPVDHTDLRQH